jgi:hypothetical protein
VCLIALPIPRHVTHCCQKLKSQLASERPPRWIPKPQFLLPLSEHGLCWRPPDEDIWPGEHGWEPLAPEPKTLGPTYDVWLQKASFASSDLYFEQQMRQERCARMWAIFTAKLRPFVQTSAATGCKRERTYRWSCTRCDTCFDVHPRLSQAACERVSTELHGHHRKTRPMSRSVPTSCATALATAASISVTEKSRSRRSCFMSPIPPAIFHR